MKTHKILAVARGLAIATFIAVLLIAVTGCSKNSTGYNSNPSPGPATGPGANEVWLQGSAFNPSVKTVAVGTTITWTNKDGYAHTVTSGTPGSPSGVFDSGTMGPNATFSHTFSAAGSFAYYCRVHGAAMTANITVH